MEKLGFEQLKKLVELKAFNDGKQVKVVKQAMHLQQDKEANHLKQTKHLK